MPSSEKLKVNSLKGGQDPVCKALFSNGLDGLFVELRRAGLFDGFLQGLWHVLERDLGRLSFLTLLLKLFLRGLDYDRRLGIGFDLRDILKHFQRLSGIDRLRHGLGRLVYDLFAHFVLQQSTHAERGLLHGFGDAAVAIDREFLLDGIVNEDVPALTLKLNCTKLMGDFAT